LICYSGLQSPALGLDPRILSQVLALEQLCCIKADSAPVNDRLDRLEARVAELAHALADSRRQAEQVPIRACERARACVASEGRGKRRQAPPARRRA
jgi:hypothetical protein